MKKKATQWPMVTLSFEEKKQFKGKNQTHSFYVYNYRNETRCGIVQKNTSVLSCGISDRLRLRLAFITRNFGQKISATKVMR